MRALNAAAINLLNRMAAGERIGWVQLVQMDLSVTLRLTTAGRTIPWGGFSWLPAGLGSIEPIEDDIGELRGLSFTMPGIDNDDIALVVTEPVEGKTVRVYDALIDPSNGTVAHAELAWSGTLNVPTLADGEQAIVTVTAEHRGMQALRPKGKRYTHDEQLRIATGDTSLNFDPATDAAPLAWPLAAYFRK